ncbi:MAG: hypothetical protein Q4B26_02270 [Eubacteriales bacterium]|nr:hypothetical protein [Eubacteriales bacterium]
MGSNKKVTEFDKENEYKTLIAPEIKKIKKLCVENGIPFFFQACYKSEKSATTYANAGNLCGSNEIVLHDDKFTEHLKVELGFQTEVPSRMPMIMMDMDMGVDYDDTEE